MPARLEIEGERALRRVLGTPQGQPPRYAARRSRGPGAQILGMATGGRQRKVLKCASIRRGAETCACSRLRADTRLKRTARTYKRRGGVQRL
eukprot:6198827-Pleurochrysis_carterae.AAC.1